MTTVTLALRRVPDGIVWPEANHAVPATPVLWEVRDVLINASTPRLVPAFVFEEWAVHRMVEREGFGYGWATTTHPNGGRFTCSSRVFASALGAMEMAEALALIYKDFTSFTGGERDLPPSVRAMANAAFERAERDGKILHQLVTVA